MEWIVRIIAVWVLFFVLVDFKSLKINIWCGLFSIILQMAIDTPFITHNYYKIADPVVSVYGSSLFFILGPVFIVGILLAQFQPHKRYLRIIYVLLFTGVYCLEEFLLIKRNAVIYINWSYLQSVIINTVIMACLSWFSIVVLKRGGSKT